MVDLKSLSGWQYELYKKREKDRIEAEAEAALSDRPPLRDAEVIEMGYEIPVEELSGRSHPGIIAKYAMQHNWNVKAGQSKYRTADRMYKGEVKFGEEKTHQWAQGISPDGKHHFTISSGLKLFDGWPTDSVEEMKVGIFEYGIHD